MKFFLAFGAGLLCSGLLAIQPAAARIQREPWGETADHQKVDPEAGLTSAEADARLRSDVPDAL